MTEIMTEIIYKNIYLPKNNLKRKYIQYMWSNKTP